MEIQSHQKYSYVSFSNLGSHISSLVEISNNQLLLLEQAKDSNLVLQENIIQISSKCFNSLINMSSILTDIYDNILKEASQKFR